MKTAWENQAKNGVWYFTRWKNQADLILYITKDKYEADKIVFVTEWSSEIKFNETKPKKK